MAESSPLEVLQSNAASLSNLTLSSDGKEITVSNTSSTLDATVKYTVPGTPDDTSYSLASLYLLCVHPKSLLDRKRACDKYGIDDNVKVSHRTIILKFFGLGESEDGPKAGASTGGANVTGVITTVDQDAGEVEDVEMLDVEMEVTDANEKDEKKKVVIEKEDQSQKKSRDNHSKRTSREEEERRKKHHSSSRKDKDRRDRHHHKDRHSHGSSSSKKDKLPITNEQVMQNLTFLHGKRGENDLKRKSTDLPSMDKKENPTSNTTTSVSSTNNIATNGTNEDGNVNPSSNSVSQDKTSGALQNLGTNADTQTPGNEIDNKTPTMASIENPQKQSNIIPESEEERKTREKEAIQAALSSTGFEFSQEEIAADREATEKIAAMETPVGDSASVLRFASRDFSRVLGLYMEVRRNEERAASMGSSSKSKRHKKDGGSNPSSSSKGGWEKTSSKPRDHHSNQKSSSSSSHKKPLGKPVIIVPNAMTSPIGMVNASEFFSQARFVPRDRTNRAGKKVSHLTFKRKISSRLLAASGGGASGVAGGMHSNGEMEYEIVDNPSTKLSRSDWDRVVAVVAHGEKWQFKGWKWKEPVEIFSNCFGFYIGMEGAPIPKGLTGWNVKKAFLNRDKRGLDSVAHASFWNSLEEWMILNKRQYLPFNDH